MRIKWRQQLKINSENEAAPSASKPALALAAAICTEFLQILRTVSLEQRLPSGLLGALMNEERWLLQHAIIAAFQERLELRKKEKKNKKGLRCQRREICRHYSRHQKQFSEPSTATVS